MKSNANHYHLESHSNTQLRLKVRIHLDDAHRLVWQTDAMGLYAYKIYDFNFLSIVVRDSSFEQIHSVSIVRVSSLSLHVGDLVMDDYIWEPSIITWHCRPLLPSPFLSSFEFRLTTCQRAPHLDFADTFSYLSFEPPNLIFSSFFLQVKKKTSKETFERIHKHIKLIVCS